MRTINADELRTVKSIQSADFNSIKSIQAWIDKAPTVYIERENPVKAIREELGGGYYYRCPWLTCNKIVRSEYDYCPYCGTKLIFPNSDYNE